jgi:hypothetical protein
MRFCNEDGEGHHADFHALRHTFITNIMKFRINPKTAQSLARHFAIDLTVNVYTSLTVNDQAAAIAALHGLKTPNPTTGRESD